ncbi:hypothetical protein PR002_g17902 [Phytophthora rubi]|uniref:Uncharacterized protein n=1 Tax=Phytophthora rubi TaxID=129364 RepID=A0A6A3K9W4_9STRA|nr:hypothetical protein PR002_g17902 [Phytophthora rubi]
MIELSVDAPSAEHMFSSFEDAVGELSKKFNDTPLNKEDSVKHDTEGCSRVKLLAWAIGQFEMPLDIDYGNDIVDRHLERERAAELERDMKRLEEEKRYEIRDVETDIERAVKANLEAFKVVITKMLEEAIGAVKRDMASRFERLTTKLEIDLAEEFVARDNDLSKKEKRARLGLERTLRVKIDKDVTAAVKSEVESTKAWTSLEAEVQEL